jgi:hypothetical protein
MNRCVLCTKWGSKYGPEYVNRLHAMVSRHLTGAFRFVCLTDDTNGISDAVECLPLPPVPIPDDAPERGWKKIGAFSPALETLKGWTILYLDLDLVIVDALDPLFDRPEDFSIIRDWYHPLSLIGNSSVFRYSLDLHSSLFEDFCRNSAAIRRKFRNEQEYLTRYMADAGQLSFWPKEWCRSFRLGCIPYWPANLWRAPSLPADCRIIVFHGDPKPPEAISGSTALSLFFLPAPWIAEHWRD